VDPGGPPGGAESGLAEVHDLRAGFASPSDDGGLLEFCEFIRTLVARSATCDRSAVSSSRSRAFTARSPVSSVESERHEPAGRPRPLPLKIPTEHGFYGLRRRSIPQNEVTSP
jgi:hypothetical protein